MVSVECTDFSQCDICNDRVPLDAGHYDGTCCEPQAPYGRDLMDVWNVLQCCTEWADWLMSGTMVWWIA